MNKSFLVLGPALVSRDSISLFSAVGSCDTLSNKGQDGKTTVKIFPKYVHSQVDPLVIEERREGLRSFPSGGTVGLWWVGDRGVGAELGCRSALK